jgi:hypothetical protein
VVKNVHAATNAERRAQSSLRIQTYVDDPIFSLRGTKEQRSRAITMVVLLWSGLGFQLAFKKAERGKTVSWIGIEITTMKTWVIARIKAGRVACKGVLAREPCGSEGLEVLHREGRQFRSVAVFVAPVLG